MHEESIIVEMENVYEEEPVPSSRISIPAPIDTATPKVSPTGDATTGGVPRSASAETAGSLSPRGVFRRDNQSVSVRALMAPMRLASTFIPPEKRERNRIVLERLRTTGVLKGAPPIDAQVVEHPKLAELLDKYEIGHHQGNIDPDEVISLLKDLHARKRQTAFLKKLLGFSVLFLIILLICNTFLTVWMIQLTKETHVDDDDNGLVALNGEMVKTEKPKYYTAISSIASLPSSALDSITRMSFMTIDGGVYNLVVNGVRLDAKYNDTVYIYFASNKRMYLKGNDTAMFIDADAVVDGREEPPPEGVAVVLNTDDPLSTSSASTARRLLAVQEEMVTSMGLRGEAVSTALADRCLASGVCLYTYEEMTSLFDQQAAARRRLDLMTPTTTTTMTYTEITADARLLSKDDRGGLSRAQGFLAALLAEQEELKNGTLQIKFVMMDLCSNYPSLAEDCRRYPAPAVSNLVNVSSLNDTRPFLGLVAEDGVWMFQDEIEYLIDTYSIQVKVRYAHDPFRETRRHVVLMDVKSGRLVTYDEVTIQYDPRDPNFAIYPPLTVITNYNASGAAGDGTEQFTSENDLTVHTSTSRRLEVAEARLWSHLRTKIAGFPSIVIATEMDTDDTNNIRLQSPTAATTNTRRLNAVGSSRNISFDTEMSTTGVYCVTELVDNQGNVLPCLSPMTDGSITVEVPTSYFPQVEMYTLPGMIVWPKPDEIYAIEEYETAEILYRADLKHVTELALYAGNESSTTTRRLLATTTYDHPMQQARIEQYLARQQARRQLLQQRFEAVHRAFQEVYSPSLSASSSVASSGQKELEIIPATDRRQLAAEIGSDDLTIKTYKNYNRQVQYTAAFYEAFYMSPAVQETLQEVLGDATWSYIAQFLAIEPTPTVGFDGEPLEMLKIPVRPNSTCAEFHQLMGDLYGEIAEVNDLLTNTILISAKVDKLIERLASVQSSLAGLINVNSAMKPTIPVLSKIPYAGPVLKITQMNLNTIVTAPITPIKSKVDAIQNKITQYQVKNKNYQYLTYAENTAYTVKNFVLGSEAATEALVVIDAVCQWTPTTVQGQVTYNHTETGSLCHDLSIPLKAILQELAAIKTSINNFLDQFSLLGQFMDFISSFLATFDVGIINILNVIFQQLTNFLQIEIGTCIPWVCFSSNSVCTAVKYPCGTKKKWGVPVGVKWCTETTCTSVPVPTPCSLCARYTIQQILDGLMSVVEQLQDVILDALDSLASALNIQFPSLDSLFNLPWPSLDILSTIENMLGSLFESLSFVVNIQWLTDLEAFLQRLDLSGLPQCKF